MNNGGDRKKPFNFFERLGSSDELIIEAVKIFVGGLLGAVTMLGYSYSHTFYGQFGIALADLNHGPIDHIFRGLFFLVSPVPAVAISLILLVFVLVILWGRRREGVLQVLVSCIFAFTALIALSISLGVGIARWQTKSITHDGSGKVLMCKMHDPKESEASRGFVELIEKLSRQEMLRFIARNEHYSYAAYVSKGNEREGILSYAIPNSSIVFCHMYSSFPRAFGDFRTERQSE